MKKNHILFSFKPDKNVVIQSVTEGLAETGEKSRTYWVKLSEFLICSKKPHQNWMLRTAAHCAHVLTLRIANSILARWRSFYARANEFEAISADKKVGGTITHSEEKYMVQHIVRKLST